jgi:hypothetical protein
MAGAFHCVSVERLYSPISSVCSSDQSLITPYRLRPSVDYPGANSLYADLRNFYKVEAWSRDGMHIDALLYAGNNLDKAREIFVTSVKHRPRIRLTIRQRTRVLDQWPRQ